MYKKLIATLLALVMLLQLAGCGSTPAPAPSEPDAAAVADSSSQPDAASQPEPGEDAIPEVGDVISGFTLKSVEAFSPFNADILTFRHEKSGAELCYIKNDDTNRAFTIAYRTPMVDETDTNHIFEHAVIASSEKYPSKNLFFDIMGRSYNTFVNAYTYTSFTMYPASSLSEEQLTKIADAVLSCMVSPDLMEDERFFKREALRYMLYDVEEPITMGGTVFSEDMGYMTSIDSEAYNNLLDALYPGEYASNMIGRAFSDYQNLTYEHMKKTYDRAYHFDNALILLYGDLDYKSFLEFLDSEYLSKTELNNTDLSAYNDPKTAPGHEEQLFYAPAYEGDSTEDASVIYYGIDLDGCSGEDISQYELLSWMLSNPSSVFQKNLKEAGLTAPAAAGIEYSTAKPIFIFEMNNANPEDAAAFKAAVEASLAEIAENGMNSALVESTLKSAELDQSMMLESENVIINAIFPRIIFKWVKSGETDALSDMWNAPEVFAQDSDQALIRKLAASLADAERTALVTTVPQPGLAEEMIAEQERHLAEMKASMTQGELEEMVADTLAFDEWNASEMANDDFVIPVQSLPDPEQPAAFTKEESDGATWYTAAAEVEKVSSHSVMFDTSGVSQENLHYISLYSMLLNELATSRHSRQELDNLTGQILYNFSTQVAYPTVQAGQNHHPVFHVSWNCLSEDYGASLDLLLELLGELKLEDGGEILRAMDKNLPGMNLARGDAMDIAAKLAATGGDTNQQYKEYMTGQSCYDFLSQLRQRLEDDPAAMDEVKSKLHAVSEQILHKDRMIVANIASEKDLEEISVISREKLGALPSLPAAKANYQLPQHPARTAAIIEGFGYSTCTNSYTDGIDDLSGTLFPFISALSDRYTVPEIRFKGLAYSAASYFTSDLRSVRNYTYSDPNVAETIAVFDGLADALASLELTQEDMDSYILNAYSTVTTPSGPLGRIGEAISRDISGFDVPRWQRLAAEIKTATVEDKDEAVETMRRLIENQWMVTVGNAEKIEANADQFEKVYDYRKPLDQQS